MRPAVPAWIRGPLHRSTCVLFAVFGVPYLVRVAYACVCTSYGSPEELLSETPLVFVGTVSGVEPAGCIGHRSKNTLVVDEAFKGTTAGATFVVKTGGPTDCDTVTLDAGSQYVFFLGSPDASVSVCTPVFQVGAGGEYRYCELGWDTADGYPATKECDAVELDGDSLIDALRAASG